MVAAGRLGGAIPDGGEAHPAVLCQAADHMEDNALLSRLIEVQTVASNDVEQIGLA
jgi:hypothetical protein